MLNGMLPDGWTWTTVGEIGKVKGGKRLPQGHTYSEESTKYPYIRVVDFGDLTINTDNLKYLKEETQKLIKQYTISKEDVFISIAGSIGKVGVVPGHLNGANLTENAAKITDLNGVHNKYLAYVLASQYCQEQMASLTISTNQPKLALFRIEKINFPLPPLPEQERIVAKIEELFTQLEKGTSGLERVQAGLRRYKASVLKAAVEGKLATSGKAENGELPKGWRWKTLKDVCLKIQDGTHYSPKVQYERRQEGMYLYITAKNIKEHGIILDEITFIDEKSHRENTKLCDPKKGDVLLIKDGLSLPRFSGHERCQKVH